MQLHRMLLIDTLCFYTPTGPFNRDFGNSLDLCLNPIQHPPNFCTSQNVPDNAPTSFVRYRTINGTCNNLQRGKATFGAAGIVAARFLPESTYLKPLCIHIYIQTEFGVSCFRLSFVIFFEIAFWQITSSNCLWEFLGQQFSHQNYSLECSCRSSFTDVFCEIRNRFCQIEKIALLF